MGEPGSIPSNAMFPSEKKAKDGPSQDKTSYWVRGNVTSSPFSCLRVVDQLIVIVFVSPLVVGYWRGTWQLLDIYLFPDSLTWSAWVSFAIGTLVPTGFVLAQRILGHLFRPDRSFLVFFYFSRLYSALFAITVVNHWRGVWKLLDVYTGTHAISNGVGTLVGALGLAYWRGLRNILAPPLVVFVDSPRDYFTIATRFRQQKDGPLLEFTLDATFSVFVLGSLVVFVWRGAWGLIDVVLFPEDKVTSGLCSLILGFCLTTFFLLLQRVATVLVKSLTPTLRLLVEDVFIFVANLAPINVWRGCWMLLDLYLYPDDYELSNWVTHVTGFVILLLMYCVNSILVRGVCVDGENEDGRGCSFETDYLIRIFRSRWHEKKKVPVSSPQEEILIAPLNPTPDGDVQHNNPEENGSLLTPPEQTKEV